MIFSRKTLSDYVSFSEILLIWPLIIVCVYVAFSFYEFTDWSLFFRPATLRFLSGENPYDVLAVKAQGGLELRIYNPPWALVSFTPFAILPNIMGGIVIRIVGILTYWIFINHITDKLLMRILFLYSAPVFMACLNGQIEFFVLLSVFMPAQYGIWFSSIKPQIGAMIALHQVYLLAKKQISLLLLVLSLMGFLVILSIAQYGLWMLTASHTLNFSWNTAIPSLPLRIIVAILFLGMAYRESEKERKMLWFWAIAPAIAPYVNIFSWSVALLPFTKSYYWFVPLWILSWVVFIYTV